MAKDVITIRPDGTIQFVANPSLQRPLSRLGAVQTERASIIHPQRSSLSVAFWLLRKLVRDDSRLAGWTRTWNCMWLVAIHDGPTFGPFANRQDAIEEEVQWLQNVKL